MYKNIQNVQNKVLMLQSLEGETNFYLYSLSLIVSIKL